MNQVPREVTIGKWIGEGWKMVQVNFWDFVLFTLIYVLIIGVIKEVGIFLTGPLTYSYFYIILQRMRGERFDIGHLAKGFYNFVPAFLAGLLIGLFSFLGLFLCIIGMFVVWGMYSFTYLLMIEKNLGFWEAMEESRKIIWPNIAGFTLLSLVGGLLLFLGFMMCCIGMLVTIPIYYCTVACAYRDWVGLTESAPVATPVS
ncbi:MAG: hypothetical protein ACE14V_02905 [bacterium]